MVGWFVVDILKRAVQPLCKGQAGADLGAAGRISDASRLSGVAETTLLTLWRRAEASKRPRANFQDPQALEAVRVLNQDFARKFGKPSSDTLIRAKWSDSLIREFLARHPRALILALGDGLETQFWRVDNGSVEWLSLDLPAVISIRRRVLPHHERNRLIEGSVRDLRWLEAIETIRPTLVTANGLFMYLARSDVVQLLQALAVKFRHAEILFDTVPEWVSRRTAKGLKLNRTYQLPAMPFGVGIDGLRRLSSEAPALRIKSARTYGEPFPALTPFASLLSRWSYFRNHLSPALVHAELEQDPEMMRA